MKTTNESTAVRILNRLVPAYAGWLLLMSLVGIAISSCVGSVDRPRAKAEPVAYWSGKQLHRKHQLWAA